MWRRRKRRWTLSAGVSWFAVLWVAFLFGQPAALHAQSDPLYDAWRWVRYDTDAGLPSNRVVAMVEDGEGRLWVQTSRGIAWYDGFIWHPVGEAEGLPEGEVNFIGKDQAGRLLVVARYRLYRRDQEGFRPLTVVDGSDTLAVAQVQSLDAEALILLSNRGLYTYRDGTARPMALPQGVSHILPGQLYRTARGTVWLALPTQDFEWTGQRWEHRSDVGATYVYADSLGGLLMTQRAGWLGTWIWKGHAAPRRLEESGNRFVDGIDVGPDGETIIVYSNDQVHHYWNGQWHLLNPTPAAFRNVLFVRYQRNGDLWVSTGDGLRVCRCTSRRWQWWHEQGATVGDRINELLQTHNGDVWAGTGDGVYVRHSDGHFTHFTRAGDTPLGIVTGIAEDGAGGIWVSSGASFRGAFRWFEGRWQHYGEAEGLTATRIHRIVPDRQGRLWFLGHGAFNDPDSINPGAFVYDGKHFEQWGEAEGLLNGRVYSFAEGPDGALWFGTMEGLSRWKEGRWTHWTIEQGLSAKQVFAINMAPDGRLWLGHRRSKPNIGYVDAGDHVVYLDQAASELSDVWDLKWTPDSTLWVASSNGLGRYRDGVMTVFRASGGLTLERLWPVLPQKDRVVVGTLGDGVAVLNLAESRQPAPRVVAAAPGINEHDVHFHWKAFAYLGMEHPEEIATRYRLDGGPWSSWSRLRERDMTNLSSGHHVFEIQARSLFGQVATMDPPLSFRVVPPFYLRPLFLGLMVFWVLSIVGVGLSYWRQQRHLLQQVEAKNKELEARNLEIEYKNEALEAQNAELERFTYTVSHDLKTPLVTIKGFLGLLKEDVANENVGRAWEDIAHINSAADKMGRLLNELLELSRIGRVLNDHESIPLTELAQDALSLVKGRIDASGVVVDIAEGMPVIEGDRMRLLEVYQNLLDNAIKFMGKQQVPRVEVGAQYEDGMVLCWVRDNGIGIDRRYHEKVFGLFERLSGSSEGTGIGLALVRRIIEVHGGRIWVASEGKGAGSTFWFLLPFEHVDNSI